MNARERSCFLSICVPTYNRAQIISDLLISMDMQEDYDFEAIIVSDGSTDNTDLVINHHQKKAKYKILYIKKENGGRARAINEAFKYVSGVAVMIMDDDDFLLPGSISKIRKMWESIDGLKDFCGIAGLCEDEDGKVLGGRITDRFIDSDFFTASHQLGLTADKKEIVRSELIRDFRFPVYDYERRSPTSTLWYKLAQDYKVRIFSESLVRKRFLDSGMSKNIVKHMLLSPKTTRDYYEAVLQGHSNMPINFKIKYIILFIKFSLASGDHMNHILNKVKFLSNSNFLVKIYLFLRAFYSLYKDKLKIVDDNKIRKKR